MRTLAARAALPFLAAAALAAGCRSGPTGRVQDPGEPVGVDVHGAGVDILDPMMKKGVEEILSAAQGALAGSAERPRLIFAGIENNSDERLGEKREYLYDTVDTIVGQFGTFDMVSRTFVENMLSQMGQQPRVELLIDPKMRRAVVERFEQAEGRDYVRYVLWGKFNNATSEVGADATEKKYALVLELVDVKTGAGQKRQVFGRKAYTR